MFYNIKNRLLLGVEKMFSLMKENTVNRLNNILVVVSILTIIGAVTLTVLNKL
jgi:hypothetical protein